MANTTFSPKIFAKETIRIFNQKNVFQRYANTDYSGELQKAGDSVMVQIAPTLTFTASSITSPGATDFTTGTWPGGTITATDFVLTSENLVINKYVEKRFVLKDFELKQSNLNLEEKVATQVSVALANLLDSDFRDQILVTDVATIPTANKLYSWSPKSDVSKTTIYGYIEEMRVALANQNVTDNLVLFLCPKHYSALLQSGLLDAHEKGFDVRTSGDFRMLWNVKVVQTNALTASFEMIMMAEWCVNYVTQITDTKITEGADGFYKNLLYTVVWWAKIFSPSAKGIAIFYASA